MKPLMAILLALALSTVCYSQEVSRAAVPFVVASRENVPALSADQLRAMGWRKEPGSSYWTRTPPSSSAEASSRHLGIVRVSCQFCGKAILEAG